MQFILSKHANKEMILRGISIDIIKNILENPQQIVDEIDKKKAYQSKIDFGMGKIYLVRVIVADDVLFQSKWHKTGV